MRQAECRRPFPSGACHEAFCATSCAHTLSADYARVWVDKPKVVFSSTFQQTNWNTRVVASGVLEEVEKLKRESSGYLLCYGGPQLVSALEERHLVDQYILYIHPAALGAGKPFFRSHTPLRLLDSRRFKVGTLELRYASGGEPG